MLTDHLPAHCQPARVHAPERIGPALAALIEQGHLTAGAIVSGPPAQRPFTDTYLRRLGLVALHQRTARTVGGTGLAWQGQLGVAGTVAAQDLSDMPHPLLQVSQRASSVQSRSDRLLGASDGGSGR